MQIALEKEFQAKEQLIEENNGLKLELDIKQHRIGDLQAQIEQLNKDIHNYQSEIVDLRDDLVQMHQHHQQQHFSVRSMFSVPFSDESDCPMSHIQTRPATSSAAT